MFFVLRILLVYYLLESVVKIDKLLFHISRPVFVFNEIERVDPNVPIRMEVHHRVYIFLPAHQIPNRLRFGFAERLESAENFVARLQRFPELEAVVSVDVDALVDFVSRAKSAVHVFSFQFR